MKLLAEEQKKAFYFIHASNEVNAPSADKEMTGHFSISVKPMQDCIAALKKIVQLCELAVVPLEASVILKRFSKNLLVFGCNQKIPHINLHYQDVKIFNIFSTIIRAC